MGFYYNRARYLNVETGRFISQDSYEGINNNPLSLHKYLYANADGVNNSDPSGRMTIALEAIGIGFRIQINVWSHLQAIVIASVIACAAENAITGTLNELGAEVDGVSPCADPNKEKGFWFRGDNYYTPGTPMGFPLNSEEALNANSQTPWEHINHEHENGGTSRYLSFSGTRTRAAFFGTVYKVAKKDMMILALSREINFLTPGDVYMQMLQEKKKIAKNARNIEKRMLDNDEVLVEGQIPAQYIRKAK